MSETPITTPPNNVIDPSEGNPFVEPPRDELDSAVDLGNINSGEDIDKIAAKKAQSLLEMPEQTSLLPATAEASTEKKPNYTARRAVTAIAGLALLGGAGVGINDAVEKNNSVETVAESTFSIPEGGTIIDEAKIAVNELLEAQGLDTSTIGNDKIVHEGQEAKREAGQGSTMPGDQFKVSLEVNGHGSHSVDISPVDSEENLG